MKEGDLPGTIENKEPHRRAKRFSEEIVSEPW
jgi:hypothetical protein